MTSDSRELNEDGPFAFIAHYGYLSRIILDFAFTKEIQVIAVMSTSHGEENGR